MTDFARFLPLGRRPRGSEEGVSSDRRAALADLVDRAAVLVATDGRGRTVFVDAFVDDAELRHDYDAFATDASPAALVTLAATVRSGRRRNVKALAAGARALLLLARDLDAPIELDPATAGAVSLYLATSGPFDRRAVVKGHTVRATDADWSFGTGPVLEGPATGIVAVLTGACEEPPRPAGPSDPG